jgi:hypothetical protein
MRYRPPGAAGVHILPWPCTPPNPCTATSRCARWAQVARREPATGSASKAAEELPQVSGEQVGLLVGRVVLAAVELVRRSGGCRRSRTPTPRVPAEPSSVRAARSARPRSCPRTRPDRPTGTSRSGSRAPRPRARRRGGPAPGPRRRPPSLPCAPYARSPAAPSARPRPARCGSGSTPRRPDHAEDPRGAAVRAPAATHRGRHRLRLGACLLRYVAPPGLLGADFEVAEPPELVERVAVLARRYTRAVAYAGGSKPGVPADGM